MATEKKVLIEKKTPVVRKKAPVVEVSTQSSNEPNLDRLKTVLDQRYQNKKRDEDDEQKKDKPPLVSLGPSGAIVDALLNTAPGKMLELTDFDRVQVALVPQVIVIDDMWDYVGQVLDYRNDAAHYRTVHGQRYPDMVDTSRQFVLTLAQVRRSLGGRMKKALEDMALAELDNRPGDDGDLSGHGDFID